MDLEKSPFTSKRLVFILLCSMSVIGTLIWQLKMNIRISPKHLKAIGFQKPEINMARSMTTNLSCDKLIAHDKKEINKTNQLMTKHFRVSYLPEVYPDLTKNCSWYRVSRNYINRSMSKEEEDYPLAFSLLIYKHAEQVERLLRAIWRPQNVYCVHVDTKSQPSFKEAIQSISKCFENVFLVSKPVSVHWGTFTVLEPELKCMKELWAHKTKWKYFINLTGQEFALKTNNELVKILKSYKGANDIEGMFKGANLDRWAGRGDPPHKIKPRKGSVHIAATREFVDYLLHNQTALDFLEWVKKTGVPDETYFATLNNNPHLKVPGGYKGHADDGLHYNMNRYKIWADPSLCNGKFVRAICIFSVGDLTRLTTAHQLFANKFLYEYHHYAYDCLEWWYFQKIEREMQGHLDFNTTFYEQRSIVSNHF